MPKSASPRSFQGSTVDLEGGPHTHLSWSRMLCWPPAWTPDCCCPLGKPGPLYSDDRSLYSKSALRQKGCRTARMSMRRFPENSSQSRTRPKKLIGLLVQSNKCYPGCFKVNLPMYRLVITSWTSTDCSLGSQTAVHGSVSYVNICSANKNMLDVQTSKITAHVSMLVQWVLFQWNVDRQGLLDGWNGKMVVRFHVSSWLLVAILHFKIRFRHWSAQLLPYLHKYNARLFFCCFFFFEITCSKTCCIIFGIELSHGARESGESHPSVWMWEIRC